MQLGLEEVGHRFGLLHKGETAGGVQELFQRVENLNHQKNHHQREFLEIACHLGRYSMGISLGHSRQIWQDHHFSSYRKKDLIELNRIL